MEQIISRYDSRDGSEEFGIVFARYRYCFIRSFVASTTHLILVTHLDSFASEAEN